MTNSISHHSQPLLSIAGTVGVGKSTLAKLLADRLGYKLSMEKVEGNPYLEDYYHDFKTWSFHLQIYFLAVRFAEQKRMYESGWGYVQDRTIYEDVGIFSRIQYEHGNMNERDYQTYRSLFEAMTMTPFFPTPTLIIYLEGSFDKIMERIRLRGRKMELETPISYWQELYERYHLWIEQFDLAPVLRINIDKLDLLQSPADLDNLLSMIHKRLSPRINDNYYIIHATTGE